MPHIAVKMYKGRTDEQKKNLSKKILDSVMEAINIGPDHISISIEDYDPADWGGVVETEIGGRPDILYIKGGKAVK